MKIKTIIITMLFFSASVLELRAQDKFEYGVVTFLGTGAGNYIIVTTLNESIETSKGKAEGAGTTNFIPLHSTLNALQDQGWQLYNTDATEGYRYFYVKRKKG